ncbi:uncharacterized protein METZ01_LOCUS461790 [marine metagenome]|uniref:Uncharacterized protein n=1 Tax=marine metagenome TaxID=408172 RepID=A0A383ALZ6_9ZZZZ
MAKMRLNIFGLTHGTAEDILREL